ncbi:MAG: Fe-S protein assembly co-chaperone HscB [Planctomycetota bacterium]
MDDGSDGVQPESLAHVADPCGRFLRNPEDHFKVFGLERRFELDEPRLEKSFLELSRALHPDRHRDLKEKTRALAATAAMNQAYGVLKDRTKRAEYLLKLLGGAPADKDKRTPPGFLTEVLEMREEVESTSERARLEPLLADLEGRERGAWSRIEQLFRAGDTSEIRLALNSLKYVTNLAEELRKKLRG